MFPSRLSAVAASLVLAATLAGCLGGSDDVPGDFPLDAYTSVRERHLQPFEIGGEFSYTLEEGPFAIRPAEDVFVSSELPLGHGVPTAQVNLGRPLPEVPAGTKVPVVADVGPYYDGFEDPTGAGLVGHDTDVTEPAERLGLELILTNTGRDYLPSAVSSSILVDLDRTTLRLPVVERAPAAYFTPPGSE